MPYLGDLFHRSTQKQRVIKKQNIPNMKKKKLNLKPTVLSHAEARRSTRNMLASFGPRLRQHI